MLEFLGLSSFVYADLFTILVLIVMEGLLSCDNAVVLALLVKGLPEEQRAKALKYGIVGAYIFRIIALCLASFILSVWWLKCVGGAYLLYVAGSFFFNKEDKDDDGIADVNLPKKKFGLSVFWSTVLAVELTDIAFSVDSIAASVALSSKLWVLIVGGMLGILAMRFAASGFLYLLQRFPSLEVCAFVAVAFIGAKLVVETPSHIIFSQPQAVVERSYKDHSEYIKMAEESRTYLVDIPYIIKISTNVPEQADQKVFEKSASLTKLDPTQEKLKADAAWNTELTALVKFDHIFSSILVMFIFAVGFIIPNKHKNHI